MDEFKSMLYFSDKSLIYNITMTISHHGAKLSISTIILIILIAVTIVLLHYFMRAYIQKKKLKKRIENIKNEIQVLEKEHSFHSEQMGNLFMAGEGHAGEGFKMEKCEKEIKVLEQILANEEYIQSRNKTKM